MIVKNLIQQFNQLNESQQAEFRSAIAVCTTESRFSPAWEAEIHRRMQRIQDGETTFSDSEVVEKRLAKEYGVSF
ncbi:MAG: addiction module protein [Bacteroidota bacterium]